MCGIFGYIGNRTDAQDIVFEGLKSLEYRGYDSWGVAVVTKFGNKKLGLKIKKKAGKIGDNSVSDLPLGNVAIGHTRWATHGGVTDVNAHPHKDCTGSIALIHNGIFENYEGFKQDLINKGHKFVSETDTETLVHLIEELRKKYSFAQAVKMAFQKMEGLNAVIAIENNGKEIVAVRNGSPLVIGFSENENFIASDASAILPYTRNVYFLEDNNLCMLSRRGAKIFDIATGKEIAFKPQKLDWKVLVGTKGKFPDFMSKEIYEQPSVLSEIVADGYMQAVKIAKEIKKFKEVYLVGCGTASYACLAGTYLFSKVASKKVSYAVGSEFGYQLNFLKNDSLVIAVSQSGETMDILESVKKAKERGAKILCLVNVFGSTLYRLSDYKMTIGAGQEKAVASTKAFTAMVAHLILVSFALVDELEAGRKLLSLAVKATKKVLGEKSTLLIKKIAQKISNSKHIYVIGRGISYSTSLETALKIKEISYIHAEGLAAGELKHGPLALVEKGTPCIAFLPDDETYGANLAGAMEMKARGGFIIGVSQKNHEVFDYHIPVDDSKEATIVPHVVVGQLLAYHLTKIKGLDPDKPRNLAKSVTVK